MTPLLEQRSGKRWRHQQRAVAGGRVPPLREKDDGAAAAAAVDSRSASTLHVLTCKPEPQRRLSRFDVPDSQHHSVTRGVGLSAYSDTVWLKCQRLRSIGDVDVDVV